MMYFHRQTCRPREPQEPGLLLLFYHLNKMNEAQIRRGCSWLLLKWKNSRHKAVSNAHVDHVTSSTKLERGVLSRLIRLALDVGWPGGPIIHVGDNVSRQLLSRRISSNYSKMCSRKTQVFPSGTKNVIQASGIQPNKWDARGKTECESKIQRASNWKTGSTQRIQFKRPSGHYDMTPNDIGKNGNYHEDTKECEKIIFFK